MCEPRPSPNADRAEQKCEVGARQRHTSACNTGQFKEGFLEEGACGWGNKHSTCKDGRKARQVEEAVKNHYVVGPDSMFGGR